MNYTVLADNAFLNIGLPIICAVVGIAIGVCIVLFVPVFKKQSANKKASKIIRDADKVDILRVNYETPMEEIYNTNREILITEKITDAVKGENSPK